jgi:hypothetical protein
MDLRGATDEELDQIVIQGAYHHGPRKAEIAQLEVARRRSDRLYAQQKKSAELLESTLIHIQKVAVIQEEISKSTSTQLRRIINILDKPVRLILIATGWGILVAVIINVVTAYLCQLLRCPR